MAKETASEREKRLAEALRRNLARRKQQARTKSAAKSAKAGETRDDDQL